MNGGRQKRLLLIREILDNGGHLYRSAYGYHLTENDEIIKWGHSERNGKVWASKAEVEDARNMVVYHDR